MNYLCRAGVYLNSVTSTVNSLAGMVMSDELRNNIESQFKIAVTLIELEQATADFIANFRRRYQSASESS